jgi:hypothetical protein
MRDAAETCAGQNGRAQGFCDNPHDFVPPELPRSSPRLCAEFMEG